MPWYSEEQIEEVRSRSDIVSVIGRYVRLKRTGSGYTGLCPFHNEKTPSFHVNPARQMYKCFGCGVGGNVLTFVMEYENLTFPEAMEMLAEQAGIDLPKQEMTAQQKQQTQHDIRCVQSLLPPGGQAYDTGIGGDTVHRAGPYGLIANALSRLAHGPCHGLSLIHI